MSPGWQLDRIQRIFNYSWGSNPKFSTWSGTSRSFAWSGMNLTAPWSKVWPWNVSQILVKFLTKKGRPEKWNQQLKPSNVSWWTPSQLRKEKTQERKLRKENTCHLAVIRLHHSLWWTLRKLENTGSQAPDSWITYQGNNNESWLLHLPRHRKVQNFLTWEIRLGLKSNISKLTSIK